MCKLMIVSGIKDETKDNAWLFVKEMSRQMSSPNSPENDGIGYAAIDNEGKLFGERWFNNKEAFQHQSAYGSEVNNDLMKKFKILNMKKVYNSFGILNENIRSITLHSRASTNTKELRNNHPFVEGFTSVIHNGVIRNDDKFLKKTSSCDSEVILHEYIKHNVANKIFKIKKLASKLEGYYAMGIFSKMLDGTVILDVLRDDVAKLDAYYVKELETVVFATPRFNGTTVEDACKALGFTILSKLDVKANRLQRFNAMTGEAIGFESFKPKESIKPTWKGSVHGGYGNGYDDYHGGGYTTYREKAYQNAFEKDKSNNVIDIVPKQIENSHSKDKHDALMLEKELEDMIKSSKDYTEEEIKKLQEKYLPKVIDDLTKEINNFNDDGDSQWYMDEKFTWHKKG